MFGLPDRVWIPRGPLGTGVRLVHQAILPAHQLEQFLGICGAVDRAEPLVLRNKLAPFRTVHPPIDRLGKDQTPMSPEVDVSLFGGDQQEVLVGLRLARLEEACQLAQAQFGEIARMAITVEVHDDRGVDAHLTEHGLEGRSPVHSLLQRLHRIGEVEVRGQRLEPVQLRERVPVGVAQGFLQKRLRRCVADEQEQRHCLAAAGRCVGPRVELPVGVADVADAQRDLTAPRAVPVVRQVRGEVAGNEELVRRGKGGHAALARGRCHGAVAHLERHALGLQAIGCLAPQPPLGVVVRQRREHVAPGLDLVPGHELETSVIEVGNVLAVSDSDGLLLDQARTGKERVDQRSRERTRREAAAMHSQTTARGLDPQGIQGQFAEEGRRALRVVRGVVEEGVPALPADAGLHTVERPRLAQHLHVAAGY